MKTLNLSEWEIIWTHLLEITELPLQGMKQIQKTDLLKLKNDFRRG